MDPERKHTLLALLQRLGLEAPPQLTPIEEALCHTSARAALNHERLEFLGDAVLRLAAAEFLALAQPRLSVGQWSALRAQLVSDRWLADLGQRCGLEAVAKLGPVAVGDTAGRRTVLAELCEALVGGVYEAWGGGSGGLAAVHRWLDPHWQQATGELLADPYQHNWKSALQEWSQGAGRGLPRYGTEEVSRRHGDPRRFHCQVWLGERRLGEGWGGARREAEQQAARAALEAVRPQP